MIDFVINTKLDQFVHYMSIVLFHSFEVFLQSFRFVWFCFVCKLFISLQINDLISQVDCDLLIFVQNMINLKAIAHSDDLEVNCFLFAWHWLIQLFLIDPILLFWWKCVSIIAFFFYCKCKCFGSRNDFAQISNFKIKIKYCDINAE